MFPWLYTVQLQLYAVISGRISPDRWCEHLDSPASSGYPRRRDEVHVGTGVRSFVVLYAEITRHPDDGRGRLPPVGSHYGHLSGQRAAVVCCPTGGFEALDRSEKSEK